MATDYVPRLSFNRTTDCFQPIRTAFRRSSNDRWRSRSSSCRVPLSRASKSRGTSSPYLEFREHASSKSAAQRALLLGATTEFIP
jgi:hypothetical protein